MDTMSMPALLLKHSPPKLVWSVQTVKMGVQYSLWGGSVLNLGSTKHRERFFDDINSFRAPGCFAMTELKHGSNVAMLQTVAMLDVAKDEWVITTPSEGAIKWCVTLRRQCLRTCAEHHAKVVNSTLKSCM